MTHVRFAEVLKDYLEDQNISNKEFATRIGITPKHLIDILNGEVSLSPNIIVAISIVTSIPTDYILKMEENYIIEEYINTFIKEKNITLNEYLNKFSYKELIKKNWINFTYIDNKIDILIDILKYLRVDNPYNLYKIDKNIFYKSNNNKPEALMLWLERCYKIAKSQEVDKYNRDNIIKLVDYINNNAINNIFNENLLIKEFNKYGIQLVIEDDLPGSKIRGAFKVNGNVPSIYITRKHKRIADIYFALLHELAHCKSDYNKAKSTSIVSYLDEIDIEEKADIQALNWMIDDKDYNMIKSNIYNINNSNYPKCFIVYRLAKDNLISYKSNLYQSNNILIDKY